jgi:hypothetical protein
VWGGFNKNKNKKRVLFLGGRGNPGQVPKRLFLCHESREEKRCSSVPWER